MSPASQADSLPLSHQSGYKPLLIGQATGPLLNVLHAFIHLILLQPNDVGAIITPISQMRKLRLREANKCTPAHTAKWQGYNLRLSLAARCCLLPPTHTSGPVAPGSLAPEVGSPGPGAPGSAEATLTLLSGLHSQSPPQGYLRSEGELLARFTAA